MKLDLSAAYLELLREVVREAVDAQIDRCGELSFRDGAEDRHFEAAERLRDLVALQASLQPWNIVRG